MGKKNGLPDRWEDYSNMGRRIAGTRFICFKVPLDQKFEQHGANFSVRDLTDHCTQLGLVIDLTNTSRYYNPNSLGDNVSYQKIFTEGKVLPSTSVVRKFIDTVNDYLEKNPDNDKLVGVHCTHGINRTGYLVCRYMIQVLDIAPDQAISDFNSARGHDQERPLYTDDLRKALWINEDPATYKLTESGQTKTYGYNNRGGYGYNQDNRRYSGGGGGGYNQDNRRYSGGGGGGYNRQRNSAGYGGDYGNGGHRHGGGGNSDNYSNSSNGEGTPTNGSSRKVHSSWTNRTPDSQESWRVTPKSPSPYKGEEAHTSTTPTAAASSGDDATPRGRKRNREDEDDNAGARGPWMPPCTTFGEEEPPPRLRFKRKPQDDRYDTRSQSYDPYFYQRRQGGGPDRGNERPGPVLAAAAAAVVAGAGIRQYKGPKRYRSPKRSYSDENKLDDVTTTNQDDALGLGDHEPLTFPKDLPPRKGFLGPAPNFGPSRDPKSPCTEPDVFSPEPAPGASNKRRKSKQRFLPY